MKSNLDKELKLGIKLRPYHPTYVVGYFSMGEKKEGFNKDGFNDVICIQEKHENGLSLLSLLWEEETEG